MNRLIFMLAVIAAGVMLVPPLAHGQRRFGCSGGCYTPVVHHAPVVRNIEYPQTFIFNNIAPPGDLSPRGLTTYGVSRALEYNAPSSALYLDIARRSLEVASEMGGNARGVDADILQAASIDAQGRAVEAAFRALKPDVTARSTSTTTKITLRNGIPVFEDVQPEAQAVPRDLSGNICLKCHAVGGSAAAKFVIDDTFTFAKYQKAKAAVESGSMPPKAALTDAEKDAVVLKLGKLVP